ncbi:MAG: archease [bacterium]|nr:archease [bacterium]MDT8365054.1 archease [bacterium]
MRDHLEKRTNGTFYEVIMAGGFRELENITADLGIEAWGIGLEDAFTSAVHGLASLLSDSSGGDQPLTRSIRIEAGSLPSLLVKLLNEIIYLEDTESFLPGKITHLNIRNNHLDATFTGAIYDPEIHTLNAHIKAATYHGLEIDQSSERVTIKVIFDV